MQSLDVTEASGAFDLIRWNGYGMHGDDDENDEIKTETTKMTKTQTMTTQTKMTTTTVAAGAATMDPGMFSRNS